MASAAPAAAGTFDEELFGFIVVVRGNGEDGGRFPLMDDALIGR